jgi:hypothetical protein
MQRRIDRVRISLTGRDPIEIGWSSRDLLLDEIAHLKSSRPIRDRFEDVGTSAPVDLTTEQKRELLVAIDDWAVRAGDELPEAIQELRGALDDDVAALV